MLNKFNYYFLIVLIAACSILVSCGDDGDANPNSIIVGSWNYSSYNFSGTINGKAISTFLVENMNLTPQQAAAFEAFYVATFVSELGFEGSVILFNPDGTYIVTKNGVQEDSGTYVLQNNNTKLILNSSNSDVQEFDVKELTNNKLVISFTGEGQEDVTNDGIPENIAFTLDLTFVK